MEFEDHTFKISQLELLLKQVAGCTRCEGCQKLAKEYLDSKDVENDTD